MRFSKTSRISGSRRMNHPISFLVFCLLLVNHCAFSQAEESFTIKRYTSTNGLPQNSIRSLVMDGDRFLWMTTEDGLVRFDGRYFKVYNQSNHPEINNDRFRGILKTMDGHILVSELTGTTFELHNGKAKLIRKGNPQQPVEMLIKGTAPDVEFYLQGLERKFQGIADAEIASFPLRILPLDDNQYGVFLNKTSIFKVFKDKKAILDIPVDFPGPVLFFSLGKKVYCFDNNKNLYFLDLNNRTFVKTAITGDLLKGNTQQFRLVKNIIWNTAYPDVHIKVDNKLYSLSSTETPTQLNSKLVTNQLPDNCIVSDAFYDTKSNNLFIGTDTKGFYIFKKNNLKTLIYNDPFDNQSGAIYSQCEIDSHTVFTAFKKEFNILGGRKSTLDISNNNQECLIKDKKNRIFYTVVDSIKYYDINNKVSGLIPSPAEIREYFCFALDGDSILVGNSKGMGYIKDDKYHHVYHQSDNSPKLRIEDIKRGPDGNIWIARCTGVAMYNAKTGVLNDADGLNNICATTLYVEGTRMLIGTYGDGYYAWENGKAFQLPLDKNKNLSHVHSFLIDKNNYLWMSTNKGLFRTRYENVLGFIKGKQQTIHYEYFGQDDGISNIEFNGGCSPSVLRLKNGYVSYPTMEGMVWFIPELIHEDQPDENILIDEFWIDGKQVELRNNTELPPKHESIEIRFATPYWGNNANLNLEYKLEGFNKDWVPINPDEHSLSFSNLSSGAYELKIRKLQQSGDQPFLQASFSFGVGKKYFETPWFMALAFLATAGLFYVLVLLNSRRIINKNNELEKKIAERTIELKNVNHQLEENVNQLAVKEKYLSESIDVKNRLISIISHDIITPLKFISMVSRISKKNPDMLDRNKLIESMNDIEFASDKLYNNASNILNWMKFQNNRIVPKMDHIALHDFIEDIVEQLKAMAETKGIHINNLVPEEEIIISDRNILMIILQNILSNAIKYTERGTITFSSERTDNKYLIKVKDNGIGMSDEIKKNISQIISRQGQLTGSAPDHENGNQLGYYIIVDFVQLLNGTIDVDSAPGRGTSVTISFEEKN